MRRVLLVEDHQLVASALGSALRTQGYEVEHCSTLTVEGVSAAAQQFRPDVVLLDLYLGPEFGTSIPLIGPLRDAGARVVMLTASTDRHVLAECIEAGAEGLLTKSERLDGLVQAIEDVAEHGSLVSPQQREYLLANLSQRRQQQRARKAPFERLTRREQEILAALMRGSTAQAIAEETFTSIRTVRGHIQAILDKLDVSSQVAAVAKAQEAGWRQA